MAGGLTSTAAAVPIGAATEDATLSALMVEQAAAAGFVAAVSWAVMVALAWRSVARWLERRRIDAWGEL